MQFARQAVCTVTHNSERGIMASKVVIGIFDDYDAAGNVIDGLKTAGFTAEQISILGKDVEDMRSVTSHVLETEKPDKFVKNMTIGGAVGGLLIGLASAVIPGIGSLLVAGPIMAAISGAAAGTYIGFLAGVLAHFDVPEYQAKIYESHLEGGKILVAVHTEVPEERFKAEQVMDRHGAIVVDTKAA
jgi:hypothetical protein